MTLPEFMPMVWQYANLSCLDHFGQSPVGRIVVSSSCEALQVIGDRYIDESGVSNIVSRELYLG